MTNFEWLKEEINKMNMEEIFNFRAGSSPWCKDTCEERVCPNPAMDCSECAIEWSKKLHKEPMPKLKNGMFVETEMSSYITSGYGVVINDEIIFQSGHHGSVKDMIKYITKIFEATCFIDCEDDVGIIWERN